VLCVGGQGPRGGITWEIAKKPGAKTGHEVKNQIAVRGDRLFWLHWGNESGG